MRATKFKIPVKRFDRVVKTALSSPVEHFEKKLVFWRKSCFLFTFWTGSELSFWILLEISSRFVWIAFMSRVERIGNYFFLSKQSNFFSSFDFREKNYPTNDACTAKLSKLRSSCPKNRFLGSISFWRKSKFLIIFWLKWKNVKLLQKMSDRARKTAFLCEKQYL